MSDGNVAADQLRLFIERIERLEEEKKGMQDDIADVYLEAKSTGYDPTTMKTIVRLRKMEKNDRDEKESAARDLQSRAGVGLMRRNGWTRQRNRADPPALPPRPERPRGERIALPAPT